MNMILITYFEVNTALQFSHIYPAISSIILEKKNKYCKILQLNGDIEKVNLQTLIKRSLCCAGTEKSLTWSFLKILLFSQDK